MVFSFAICSFAGVNLEAHRDYHQVVLDVNRSLKRFPKGNVNSHCLTIQKSIRAVKSVNSSSAVSDQQSVGLCPGLDPWT